MTIENAIQRFQWRLSKGNFTPNQQDIDALNHITQWIIQQRTAVIQHDTHFAKLYCHVFGQEVNYYKGNIETAQKRMRELLSYPVAMHYNKFGEILNKALMDAYCERLGLSGKHPLQKTEQDLTNDDEIIKANQKEMEKYFNGIWDQSEIDSHLNAEISESIHLFRTKP